MRVEGGEAAADVGVAGEDDGDREGEADGGGGVHGREGGERFGYALALGFFFFSPLSLGVGVLQGGHGLGGGVIN